jgi:hypothetical protein
VLPTFKSCAEAVKGLMLLEKEDRYKYDCAKSWSWWPCWGGNDKKAHCACGSNQPAKLPRGEGPQCFELTPCLKEPNCH